MDGLFNPNFSKADSPYAHMLREAQAQEEFGLARQFQETIDRINHLSQRVAGQQPGQMRIEKKSLDNDADGMGVAKDILVFDAPRTIDSHISQEAKELIEMSIPWRKGPYRFLSHFIDSEWDSSIKWNRLYPHFKEFITEESMIADLGCNNGYFLFRLHEEFSPQLVVGFEPVHRNALQYLLLKSLMPPLDIAFLLLGYEALKYFPQTFDVILCLGILYHHPDPMGVLKQMAGALKPGGRVVIDCQGIPGEDPVSLFPQNRYAGKRNFWFLPTTTTLQNWLKRTGYGDIELKGEYPLSAEEQRVSPLAPGNSLSEGLVDPEAYFKGDLYTRTIEGYPAPIRIYLTAKVARQ